MLLTYTAAGSCTAWVSDPAAPFSPDSDCRNDVLVISFPELTGTLTGAACDHFCWDGKNGRGEWVSNGDYLVQALTSATLSSEPVTLVKTVTLSAGRSAILARIFNASGDVVAELPAVSIPGVYSMRIDPALFMPSPAGGELLSFKLLSAAGAVLGVLTWDGRSRSGDIVPNGTYFASMCVTGENSAQSVITDSFSVSHEVIGLIGGVTVAPNPVSARNPAAKVWLHYLVLARGRIAQVKLKIYASTGEIVASFDATHQAYPADPADIAHADGAGCVYWDFVNKDGQTVAPGLYIVLIEVTDTASVKQRVSKKIAVL